jgi:HAD superfamily hydrolase (TIGR01509 family)
MAMAARSFSAVIFDCDGVLVDSEILAHEIEMAVLAEIGLQYDPHDFKARFMGMSDAAFRAALDADARTRLGRPVMAEIGPHMDARYREAMTTRLLAIAGVHEAVASVACAKAVASSSSRKGLEAKLRHTGLWDPFAPHVYSAEHVAQAKPAPDLFLHAAAALRVNAGDCLVIEDSVNGVRAAQAAGMIVWGFAGGAHMDEPACTRLIETGVERLVADWPAFAAAFAAHAA